MSSPLELPTELDRLAEEFVERRRQGENPTIGEYVERYPKLEAAILEIFPLLQAMETVSPKTAASASARLSAGLAPTVEELGEYRLLGIIGRGGMGVVYEAEQKGLGRRVALKVLPPRALLDPRFVARFKIEAQAAAKLQHPNIVPVIGLGEVDGIHYYTMQFIDGRGLDEITTGTREVLRSRDGSAGAASAAAARLFTADLTAPSSAVTAAPEPGEAAGVDASPADAPARRGGRRRFHRNVAAIGLQVADALAYAHARGVLHRDVKPSNILLDRSGKAWVTDFGLCLDESSAGPTQTGDLVGTLRYMAPERFRGQQDVRADVYGLGLTLYELLAGAPAFEDPDRAALVRRITQDTPTRLRALDPALPDDLATIVHKAIAPDPSVRYPTAEALASDLRAYLEGRPIAARAPSVAYLLRTAVRRHRPLAITLGVALLGLVVSTAWYVSSLRREQAWARLQHYTASVAAAETALRDGDVLRAAEHLASAPPEYRAWEWHHLKARSAQGLRELPTMGPDSARKLPHSPDGRWIAVAGDASVVVLDDETGEPVARIPEQNVYELAWSPDSRHLAVGSSVEGQAVDGVPVWGRVAVWSRREGTRVLERLWPDRVQGVGYAPDGSTLYVGGEDCRLAALDPATLEVQAEVTLGSGIDALEVSGDGAALAVGLHDGRLVLVDAAGLVVRWSRPVSDRGLLAVTFVGGDLVAATAFDGGVHVLQRGDGRLQQVLPHGMPVWDVDGVPGSDLLVTGERTGVLHVWDARTGERRYEPRSHGRALGGISVHPDGLRFVTGTYGGTVREWDLSAGHDAHVLGRHIDAASCLAIHPTKPLVASGGVGGILRVWDLTTGEAVRTLPGHAGTVMAVAFSPAGDLVATGDNAAVPTILLRRTSDWHVVGRLVGQERLVHGLAFTPDGRLVSVGHDGRLLVWDPHTHALVHRLDVSDAPLRALAIRPGGGVIATAGEASKIYLVDPSTWTVSKVLEGHEAPVHALRYHPNGRVLASVSADETIRIWDGTSGDLVSTISERDVGMGEHTEAIEDVTFHPGGARLVTGDRSGSVSVWDWERGERVSSLRGHSGWIHAVAFQGERLVSSATDGTLRVWGTETPAEQVGALREARRRRTAALPVLEREVARAGDLVRAILALETDPSLAPEIREAASREAARRLGTRPELKAWVWRVLTPASGDAAERGAAARIAFAFARVSEIRGEADPEAMLLMGLAALRTAAADAEYYFRTAITLNEGSPEVQGIAMAGLVMEHAAREDGGEEARRWAERLVAHRAEHPEARTARLAAFEAEARERLEALR